MLEWIISSSALIAVVILLRLILKGKISLRLQYALWALVLARLLLPFSIGNSSFSIMNPVEQSEVYQEMMGPVTNLPSTTVPDLSTGGQTIPTVPNTGTPPVITPGSNPSQGSAGQTGQNTPQPPENPAVPDSDPVKDIYTVQSVDWQAVLRSVWIVGIVVLGAWFFVTNLLFAARVRKNRRMLQTEQTVPVYECTAVDTPCLFGFLRPTVYLTEEVAEDERTMRYAVEHELTHYRHKDHIWAVLRCVCLAVHWYNPLVWWAAILSKNDAELACDESTIRRLGESERAEYGRTLLRLTCEKRPALLNTATTMTGSARTIKERIALIVKKPKMAVYTLIAVVLIAAIAVGCTFTGADDRPHSFTEWTESLRAEDIQIAEVAKEYGTEKTAYTIQEEEYAELVAILSAIGDEDCAQTKPEGNNEDGYRLVLYRADKLWLFKCLSDGTVGLMFNDAETGAYFGCEGSLLIIDCPDLWAYIIRMVEEKGSDPSEDGGEIHISEDAAYLLQLLETLTVEEVTGYSANMQADTETIVPLVNAAAATYAGEYEMEYEWEWHVDLHLAERGDDSGYSPELVGFHIGISEGIVDVSCRLNSDTDPSDYVYIRLHSEELWNYIFSLYNPGGIDQSALALYEEILAERAAQTMEYHNTTGVERGLPAFTGFEITYLRLVDSFHYGYSYRVYSFDIAYLTDDPDPGRYGWPQDARPDEQGRIRGYDLSSYFVAAHAHDDLVDYGYLMDYVGYVLPMNLRMDAVESVTGEKLRLDYKRAEDGGYLYTCDGASISIPYNFEHLVEAHRDSDTWCYGLIMNPTYYLDNPFMTDQTLFSLFHLCEYSEDGGGLIFSIRRYTEEEYQTMYLNSYSRQQVFARDENYYYCVFIPTKTSDENPETAAIIAKLLEQQLEKILPEMIRINGWRAYAGGEENNVQFSDMSVVPVNYQMIFTERVQEVMNRHNAVCEERNQCAFTGYQVLSFDLKDTFTRGDAEYLIYHWEVAFLTDDPNADESQWAGSTFVDSQNRINYYDTDTFFVVCREKDHFKWDFFHYDLYSDPKDVVFDLLAEHFSALEMRDQEIYIAAHDRLSNLTDEDIKAVFDDDSHRLLDTTELAAKIAAAVEHHIVWPTGAVFPWNVRVYLSGGPDSYNPHVDEYMTLSAYERENIVDIRYHSRDGEAVTLVCEDAALYQYVRWLCTSYEGEPSSLLTLTETVTALRLPDAVISYATEYVQREIEYLNECGANPADGVSYYSVVAAKITNIEQLPTGSVSLTDGICLYRLSYRILVNQPENIMLAGGMTMEDGWLTEWGSTGQPHLLMHVDWNTGEDVWTRICITNTDVIMTDFGTREMLARYGSPYLAASIELYHKNMPANASNTWNEPFTLPVTLPVLTLSDKENDSICDAVLNNLRTSWWMGGTGQVDYAYEAAAFECVWREYSDHSDWFYGYARFFRFDENGNCVEDWGAPTILSMDSQTKAVTTIWWPGDGAAYEDDIYTYFPDVIAEFVAEPDSNRARVIRNRLLEIAKERMVPVTPSDAENRLAALTAEDIKHTAGFSEVDASEIAALLNDAVKNRIGRQENKFFFWTLELYLSGGPVYNTGTDEWLRISAGVEENLVLITYHSEAGEYSFLYCEDEALYQFVRGTYTTEESVDETAFSRFGDILQAKAQETVDRSKESANEFYPLPYTGYEIIYLKLVETFEKDGAAYEVYEWHVAFLHENPMKAGLAGGMWIDSELRVRDVEGDTYFVLCTSGDTVEHEFFFWDLYFGPDEETGRFNAHETILKRFREES